MGIEVLVVQHGEKVRSPGDPGLTAKGRQQAATVATWLVEHHRDIDSIWASPLRRARETARPIAAVFGLEVRTEARLRERMNWDDATAIGLEEFLAEWRRASHDHSYQPMVGDSASEAAMRFIAALVDIEEQVGEGTVVVVAHGGVTVDTLRSLVGDEAVTRADPDLIDDGVPSCAITRLRVEDGRVTVGCYPSTSHLDVGDQ
ncbi:MAG: histidine phosphatase family protein [Acidimicrobiales bacterium]